MWKPDSLTRRMFCAFALLLAFSLPGLGQPDGNEESSAASSQEQTRQLQRLSTGEIVVDCQEIEGTKYVVAQVLIDDTPENTWRTLANPFEFEGRICHRMKHLDVLVDKPDMSLLDCTVGVIFPIPDFRYVVESHYLPCSRVDFHRVSGSFKDFKGFWMLAPVEDGTKTAVTYSMYIDPGFPAPDWLVREAVRHELPNVLSGLRGRIEQLKANGDAAEKRTIQGARSPSLPAVLPVRSPGTRCG